jgi:hypothetical protein
MPQIKLNLKVNLSKMNNFNFCDKKDSKDSKNNAKRQNN